MQQALSRAIEALRELEQQLDFSGDLPFLAQSEDSQELLTLIEEFRSRHSPDEYEYEVSSDDVFNALLNAAENYDDPEDVVTEALDYLLIAVTNKHHVPEWSYVFIRTPEMDAALKERINDLFEEMFGEDSHLITSPEDFDILCGSRGYRYLYKDSNEKSDVLTRGLILETPLLSTTDGDDDAH